MGDCELVPSSGYGDPVHGDVVKVGRHEMLGGERDHTVKHLSVSFRRHLFNRLELEESFLSREKIEILLDYLERGNKRGGFCQQLFRQITGSVIFLEKIKINKVSLKGNNGQKG